MHRQDVQEGIRSRHMISPKLMISDTLKFHYVSSRSNKQKYSNPRVVVSSSSLHDRSAWPPSVRPAPPHVVPSRQLAHNYGPTRTIYLDSGGRPGANAVIPRSNPRRSRRAQSSCTFSKCNRLCGEKATISPAHPPPSSGTGYSRDLARYLIVAPPESHPSV